MAVAGAPPEGVPAEEAGLLAWLLRLLAWQMPLKLDWLLLLAWHGRA